MADLPAEFETRRGKLMTLMSEAEARRNAASDDLQAAENRLKAAEAEWRSSEAALSETRAGHARLEARLEAARERCQEAERRINEALACAPQEVIATAGLDAAKLPAPADIEPKLAQLREQRERLGAVNLRAEIEAQEVAAELDRLTAERDDLVAPSTSSGKASRVSTGRAASACCKPSRPSTAISPACSPTVHRRQGGTPAGRLR
jgi:chromosome segregation protein